jgi:hypothetical protein
LKNQIQDFKKFKKDLMQKSHCLQINLTVKNEQLNKDNAQLLQEIQDLTNSNKLQSE